MAKCAFLGLGVMGFPMAGHLVRAGHDVTAWNRGAARRTDWDARYKGRITDGALEAVFGKEFVFLCLGDDPDVDAVYEAIKPNIAAGMVVVDHTTASSELARRLHQRAATKGAAFVDAPISGGQSGAEAGKLAVMCGGDPGAFAAAEPIMAAYGRTIVHVGPSGAGQLCKSVNQICIAGMVQGLAEGLAFAGRHGLDMERVIAAIGGGAAQSWQMDNRWKTMTDDQFEHGFAVDWMRKDLRIALEAARSAGARLPVAALVDQFYADIQAMGGNRWDTSSLIKRLVE